MAVLAFLTLAAGRAEGVAGAAAEGGWKGAAGGGGKGAAGWKGANWAADRPAPATNTNTGINNATVSRLCMEPPEAGVTCPPCGLATAGTAGTTPPDPADRRSNSAAESH